MSRSFLLLCAAFLGLFCASPSSAQGLSFTHPAEVAPGGMLPPYCGHLIFLFGSPPGYKITDNYNVTVEVDDVWTISPGVYVNASTFVDYEALAYSQDDGGYARPVNPTTLPLSYSTTAQIAAPSPTGAAGALVILATPAAPYFIGMTLFKVHDGSGKSIPNAVVTAKNYSRDIYGDPGWDLDYPSFSGGHMTLGQGLVAVGDHAYPPGLTSDHYAYFVSASGYTTCHAYFPTGTQSGGQTVDVTLMPSGTPSPITVSASTASDNPDVAPVVPATGGLADLSALNGFVGSFFDKLKALMIELFTPQQADVDAVHASANRLFTWGPFGLAAGLRSAWDLSASDYGLTNADPRYWYFPLSMGNLTGYAIMTTPTGYTPGADVGLSSANNQLAAHSIIAGARPHYDTPHYDAYGRPLRGSAVTTATTAMDINMWQALIPDHWDCRPYSSAILVMRGLMWAGGWVSFLIYLRNKFTPDLRI